MNSLNIGETLHLRRRQLNLEVSEVILRLANVGIALSEKTLYGYERGVGSPKVNTFLALCDIYQIDNIPAAFGLTAPSLTPAYHITDSEYALVLAYRKASEDDRAIMNNLAARYTHAAETERSH